MDLFKPYVVLEKLLSFRDNGDCYVGPAFFGSCRESGKGARTVEFIEKVHSFLKRESSTVTLQTACGCSRRVNISDKSLLRRYHVAILGSPESFTLAVDNSPFPSESTYTTREFRWGRRYDEEGFKLLEEIITRE